MHFKDKEFWRQKVVGDGWCNLFVQINNIDITLSTVDQIYERNDKIICPDQKDVFRAFKLCKYSNLKVIILGQDPYHDIHEGIKTANGLAFANSKESKKFYSPSLRIIMNQVAELSEFDYLDHSLESWAEQGVLLLNTALTVENGKPGSHSLIWQPFTQEIIRLISESNSGLIFCLWGNHAKSYKNYINKNLHYILEYSHPAASIYSGTKWECPHFEEINKILKQNNNIKIQW